MEFGKKNEPQKECKDKQDSTPGGTSLVTLRDDDKLWKRGNSNTRSEVST